MQFNKELCQSLLHLIDSPDKLCYQQSKMDMSHFHVSLQTEEIVWIQTSKKVETVGKAHLLIVVSSALILSLNPHIKISTDATELVWDLPSHKESQVR